MKRYMLLMGMMLLGLLFSLGVHAATQPIGQAVNVSLINQIPDPVSPGEMVELRFRVENLGQKLAENVKVELLPQYPFMLPVGEESVRNAGTIESLQKGADGAIVKFRVVVDRATPDGYHEMRVRYSSGNDMWISPEPFIVKVQSPVALIGVAKASTTPESLAPGVRAKLSLDLKNYASSSLRDVMVKLDLSGLSLNPLGSSNEKYVGRMGAQESAKVEFDLIASPDAVSGIYKVPLMISYSDILGKNSTKSSTISVIVGDVPDIVVTLDRTDIYTKGSVGAVVLRMVNKGTTDVKFMNVQIGEIAGAEVVGSSESYIGNLDSDDFSTAEFQLLVNNAQGKLDIPVLAEYKDANNNNYRLQKTIALKIYSSSEAKKIQGNGNGSFSWVIVVVLAVAAFFGYRKWKARKQK